MGTSRQVQLSIPWMPFQCLTEILDGQLELVGQVVSTKDGMNWTVQQSNVPKSNGMPEPIWDVHFADMFTGIAAAEFGVILRTQDGGTTWKPLPERLVAARLQGVHMINPTECWIVGDKATILHTQDGGVTWNVISNAKDLRAAHFYNDELGWGSRISRKYSSYRRWWYDMETSK